MSITNLVIYIWVCRCNLCQNYLGLNNLTGNIDYDKPRTICFIGTQGDYFKLFANRLNNFRVKLIKWLCKLHYNEGNGWLWQYLIFGNINWGNTRAPNSNLSLGQNIR